jgi:hypothetical protein
MVVMVTHGTEYESFKERHTPLRTTGNRQTLNEQYSTTALAHLLSEMGDGLLYSCEVHSLSVPQHRDHQAWEREERGVVRGGTGRGDRGVPGDGGNNEMCKKGRAEML